MGAELPRRKSAAIPVVTRSPFVAFTLPWQLQAGRDSRTVVVKGTFDLVPDGAATLRAEADLASGDVCFGDAPQGTLLYPSDFAIWKPKVDVLLTGYAYAPRESSTAVEVGFRFGSRGKGFERRLVVFGERRWDKAVVRLAPGAPGRFRKVGLLYENAYGGAGFAANPVGLGRDGDRLPNLELKGALIDEPTDAPEPAGLAGIPPSWVARRAKLGTYDAAWQASRWPYFPADFDWHYFQAAPVAQQLEEVVGDEPFELVGVHSTLPVLEGTLGGVVPRCFVQRTADAGGTFQEVKLRLDTVVFDAEAMKVNLVWRGLLEVSDDDASDVAGLFVLRHDAGTPRVGLAEAEALHRAELAPAAPIAEDPDAPATGERARDAAEERLRARLAGAGIAPLTGPLAVPAAVPVSAPPAALTHPRRVEALRRLAAGEGLAGLDLSGLELSDVDFAACSLAGALLLGARLCRSSLVGCDLTGANLSGAELTDARLERARLDGADLTAASLAGARLDEASLGLAVLAGVRGEGASLRGVRGERVSFAAGSWLAARFDGATLPFADFTAAVLDDAVLDGAALSAIRLYDTRGSRTSFRQCELRGARADGAVFPQGAFHGVRAESSIWDGAVLDGASFLGASLGESSFCRASCVGAVFSGADLQRARLARVRLERAELVKANLMEALLESAELTGADLRGANLHGAETWKASLRGAKLELAIVTQSKLGAS